MCLHFCSKSTWCTKPHAHTRPINCNVIPQKDTMIPYMAQPRYPLNSQVFTTFFPFATIPATPHYPEFTDRYSPQYGRLPFSLHFMTNTPFFRPSIPHSHLLSQSHGWSNPMDATIPDSTHWQNSSDPTSTFSHRFTWFKLCLSSKGNVPGYILSLAFTLAAWWAQACNDMADFRPSQKRMSWLRKSGYFR